MDKLRVEFHCHTIYSKDALVAPQKLVEAARRKGLDRLIVTDHNNIDGALAAKTLDPELVIVGEEILTTRGEFLAAFVREPIPARLEPREALHRLKEQGAFISVSHPFDTGRGWKLEHLLEILPFVDALETFNSRCIDPNFNTLARDFAREHGLPGTVGSDAHTLRELGRATLMVDSFTDAEGLRRVIASGLETVHLSSPLIHLSSRYAVTAKKLGWVKRP
jgi:predicted metal-dependent phosphoesterase TrpH